MRLSGVGFSSTYLMRIGTRIWQRGRKFLLG